MKLAEALIERADLQKKLEILRKRMDSNAKVQEGLEPNEEVVDLLMELDALTARWEHLIVHINRTNEATRIEDGRTVSELIAKRDVLTKKLSLLGTLLNSGSELTSRYSRSEIRLTPTFRVAELQKTVDKLSKELRELDTKLQATNWLTELL